MSRGQRDKDCRGGMYEANRARTQLPSMAYKQHRIVRLMRSCSIIREQDPQSMAITERWILFLRACIGGTGRLGWDLHRRGSCLDEYKGGK